MTLHPAVRVRAPDAPNRLKAIRGTLPAPHVRRGAPLSDGAARLVDRFRLMDWQQLSCSTSWTPTGSAS